MSTIKSTRQFTKRRPQSPLVQQQQLPGVAAPTGTPPLVASSIAPGKNSFSFFCFQGFKKLH